MKSIVRSKAVLSLVMFVAVVSSIVSATLVTVFVAPPAIAQDGIGVASLTLYASARKDTEKDESYIFFDQKTGDIWVYRNESFEKHLKVGKMGDPLTKIK